MGYKYLVKLCHVLRGRRFEKKIIKKINPKTGPMHLGGAGWGESQMRFNQKPKFYLFFKPYLGTMYWPTVRSPPCQNLYGSP